MVLRDVALHGKKNRGESWNPIIVLLVVVILTQLLVFILCVVYYDYYVFLSCGYTGEDGFEISMPFDHAVSMASKLVEDPEVLPTGLGARDSLRLEAGLCLYGNDLDETTTPVEAVLGWTMGPPKSRRRVEGGFLGAEHVLTPEGKLQKPSRKRVGIMGMKAPARQGVEIYDSEENKIGIVTSGTFSPTLKKPIAMGYVDAGSAKAGTPISLKIRNKMQTAEITKMPFVPSNYYRVPE